ncbi:MAG TPA: MMPL family transporter [Mycobacteriales bacterium]|nr:MMPL family transporter [Mycobacteriales bacterium]
MLTRIANLGLRAPRRLLGIAALLLAAAAVFGAPVSRHLSAGGFADPGAASTKANNLLASRFHAGDPNLVLQVSGSKARTEGTRLVQELRQERYASQVTSYWTAPADLKPGLRSKDGRSGLVVARVAGDDDSAPKRAAAITDRVLAHPTAGSTVRAGGIATAYHQVTEQVSRDLAIAEAVAVPLTVLALIWVFGSLVAALLPLAVGIVSIVGTLAILRGLALVTDVSIYAMNLTTALGLALAIDYSLFIVSRYREETRAGRAPADAVRRTMLTAGRTVLFSALTVALSLAALLVFGVYFLRSFAYAGIAVVALAAGTALVVLPALLALLGPRVDSLDLRVPVRRWLRRPSPREVAPERTFWGRTAAAVMRRAIPVGLAVTALFLLIGSPFLGIRFGYPDDRVLPASASSHQVGDALRSDFSANAAATITIVAPDSAGASPAAYSAALSRIAGVTAVSSPTGTYAGGNRIAAPAGAPMSAHGSSYLVVRTSPDPMSSAGKRVLAAVQDQPAPWHVLITGAAAENADSLHSLSARLPLALGLIALATFCVLFLFTGSVVLPIKALVLNTLSLAATFGAMVWIFQDGHLPWLFSATVTGYLVPTMPILMFCLSFGISMDYEVFLLSRIREEWLASGRTPADNTRAVTLGLGRTGRLVTAAALLMAIVFAGLATGQVSFMQLFGTGLTLAVLMDATLVRGILVPAFMRLAGRANWWAPAPLARWHERHGWTEADAGRSDRTGRPSGTTDRQVVKTG